MIKSGKDITSRPEVLADKMSSFTAGDDDMKALRAHSKQIEAGQSANNNSCVSSDEEQWFNNQKPITAVGRDDIEAWKRLGSCCPIPKKQWEINGKVCDWTYS